MRFVQRISLGLRFAATNCFLLATFLADCSKLVFHLGIIVLFCLPGFSQNTRHPRIQASAFRPFSSSSCSTTLQFVTSSARRPDQHFRPSCQCFLCISANSSLHLLVISSASHDGVCSEYATSPRSFSAFVLTVPPSARCIEEPLELLMAWSNGRCRFAEAARTTNSDSDSHAGITSVPLGPVFQGVTQPHHLPRDVLASSNRDKDLEVQHWAGQQEERPSLLPRPAGSISRIPPLPRRISSWHLPATAARRQLGFSKRLAAPDTPPSGNWPWRSASAREASLALEMFFTSLSYFSRSI